MKSYLQLLSHIMDHGENRVDRTGVGTRGIFGHQWSHHLADGFPLLTTKKVHFKSVLIELLWFLRGDTNVRFLQEHGVTIWNEWADANGDLGPVYGKQWRSWRGLREESPEFIDEVGVVTVDQVKQLLADLVKNPFSRRHIVSAWNPVDVPQMKLPPCHTLWQCDVRNNHELNLHLYARSIDSFLGLPFNIASYALLIVILARLSKLTPGRLTISFGDLHIYRNHFHQVEEQLWRRPRELPQVILAEEVTELDQLAPEHFSLTGYDPHPAIKAPVAV